MVAIRQKREPARPIQKPLEGITPTQQLFIEALLSGKTISDAAKIAGVSRRTATWWLASKDNPVRCEYEMQRLGSQLEMGKRVEKIHLLAFQALEDLLSKKTPAHIRFQAMKLVYEAHLQRLCEPVLPQQSAELIITDAMLAFERESNQSRAGMYLFDDKNRERKLDD